MFKLTKGKAHPGQHKAMTEGAGTPCPRSPLQGGGSRDTTPVKQRDRGLGLSGTNYPPRG